MSRTTTPTHPAEADLSFTSDGLCLNGTLRRPTNQPVAVALLLPGSGPLDRDGDHRRMPLHISRLLAEVLADAGVATLRYDKRGVGASEGTFLAAGLTHAINDARAALDVLRHDALLGRLPLLVIGHSEGAFVATAVAASEPIDGLVLLSGAARDGRANLAWQADVLQDDLPAVVRMMLRLLRTDLVTQNRKRIAKAMATTADVGRMGGVKTNLRWFREFAAFDPAVHLPRINVPVLAITGAKDQQVPPEDVPVMGSLVQGPFTGHVIDDVNHILRTTPGAASLRTYRKQLDQPLDERVVTHLLDWLPTVTGKKTTP